MSKTAAVERWFETNNPPAEKAVRRLRDLILGATDGMTGHVQHGTVIFAFKGDRAAFIKGKEPGVNLVCIRGVLLQGRYPQLEGTGRAVRFLRFAETKDVSAAAAEVKAIARVSERTFH